MEAIQALSLLPEWWAILLGSHKANSWNTLTDKNIAVKIIIQELWQFFFKPKKMARNKIPRDYQIHQNCCSLLPSGPRMPSVGNNNFWIHKAITLDVLQMEVHSSQDSTNDYKNVV